MNFSTPPPTWRFNLTTESAHQKYTAGYKSSWDNKILWLLHTPVKYWSIGANQHWAAWVHFQVISRNNVFIDFDLCEKRLRRISHSVLCAMWLPKNLPLLYKLNLALGFWIPHSNATAPRKYLVWEFIFTFILVCNLIGICHSILTRAHFEHKNIGKAVITFVMNFFILVKSSYLIIGRRRLQKIINQIENFSRYTYFGGIGDYSRVCSNIKKILIAHLIGYVLCYLSLMFYFSMFVQQIKNSLSVEFNQTMSINDTLVNKFLHADIYSLMQFFRRTVETSLSLAIPVKNFAIDNLMYLCHFAIECALNAMRRSYIEKASKFHKFHISQNTFFYEWVSFHVKLKRLDQICLFLETLTSAYSFQIHDRG